MARRPRTQELYSRIVDAYRESPGNHYRAAVRAQVDRATAKNAYLNGWNGLEWAPPIKQLLEQEAVAVRAARQQASEEAEKLVAVRVAELEAQAVRVMEEANAKLEAAGLAKEEAEAYLAKRMADADAKAKAHYNTLLERARIDAVETQVDEAQMSKLGRKAAAGAIFVAASFFQNAKTLSEKFVKAFADAEFTPKQAMSAGLMLARLTKEANEAVRLALENERVRTGAPTSVVGLSVQGNADDTSTEEMRITAEATLDALRELREQVEAKAAANGSGSDPVH